MPDAAGVGYKHHSRGSPNSGQPPLVLIHGAGGTRLHWPPSLRRLPGAEVYALDLPGHGEAPGSGQSTISGYRRAVVDWMQALDLPPAVVIGHSMGGALALALALDAPPRVAGIVLFRASAPRQHQQHSDQDPHVLSLPQAYHGPSVTEVMCLTS